MKFYVNPTSTSATPDYTYTGVTLAQADYVVLHTLGSGSTYSLWGDSLFDEINVGTTFADVLVPEPSSVALLRVPALFLLRRRAGGALIL